MYTNVLSAIVRNVLKLEIILRVFARGAVTKYHKLRSLNNRN